MYLPDKGVDGWFNPAAFTEPAQVRNANGNLITLFGNAARRVGRGPGSFNTDFSLFKTFAIKEAVAGAVPRGGLQPDQYSDVLPAERHQFRTDPR